jgi:hypothetical protein
MLPSGEEQRDSPCANHRYDAAGERPVRLSPGPRAEFAADARSSGWSARTNEVKPSCSVDFFGKGCCDAEIASANIGYPTPLAVTATSATRPVQKPVQLPPRLQPLHASVTRYGKRIVGGSGEHALRLVTQAHGLSTLPRTGTPTPNHSFNAPRSGSDRVTASTDPLH